MKMTMKSQKIRVRTEEILTDHLVLKVVLAAVT